MKKEVNSNIIFRTFLLSLVVYILLLGLFSFHHRAIAQEEEDPTFADRYCDAARAIAEKGWLGEAVMSLNLAYCKVRETIQTISNPSTVLDTIVSNLVAAPFFVLFNSNVSQLSLCGVYYMDLKETENIIDDDNAYSCSGNLLTIINNSLASDVDIASPELLAEAREYGESGACDFDTVSGIGSRARGSFWGITQLTLNTALTEKPPVSLAYFAKHTARKIPLINKTAFAQSTEYGFAWGLAVIVGFWEKMRDFALAILAIIMLVVGILVITRSKVSSQTMVTVWYAIPRIIISLFLIAFSYPIGAFFINAIIPLIFIAASLIMPTPEDISELVRNLPAVLLMNLVINLTTLGAGALMAILMATFAVLGIIISLFIAAIKLLIIQTKMLMSIVIAPLIFALGALPGQDDMIKNWFKQMAAKTLAIPATIFVLLFGVMMFITPYIDCDVLSSMVSNISPSTRAPAEVGFFLLGFSSNVMSLTMLPIMATVVIFTSIGIDKKITEMIMGPQGGKKR